jgi:hypothetical protein
VTCKAKGGRWRAGTIHSGSNDRLAGPIQTAAAVSTAQKVSMTIGSAKADDPPPLHDDDEDDPDGEV